MLLTFPARYPEYLIAAMIIILAPGPSVLFIIARAIAWGRATAIASVAGNVTGAFTLSLAVAFGLGPILQASELAFIGVQNSCRRYGQSRRYQAFKSTIY